MKVTLEFPDADAEFVLELLRRLPRLTVRPACEAKAKTKELDETEFLLQHPANAKRLLAAMERSERGEYQVLDLDLYA